MKRNVILMFAVAFFVCAAVLIWIGTRGEQRSAERLNEPSSAAPTMTEPPRTATESSNDSMMGAHGTAAPTTKEKKGQRVGELAGTPGLQPDGSQPPRSDTQ